MSTETEDDLLKEFFSAYFNEDWSSDAASPMDVVEEYVPTSGVQVNLWN
jgi:hypothetical protein